MRKERDIFCFVLERVGKKGKEPAGSEEKKKKKANNHQTRRQYCENPVNREKRERTGLPGGKSYTVHSTGEKTLVLVVQVVTLVIEKKGEGGGEHRAQFPQEKKKDRQTSTIGKERKGRKKKTRKEEKSNERCQGGGEEEVRFRQGKGEWRKADDFSDVERKDGEGGKGGGGRLDGRDGGIFLCEGRTSTVPERNSFRKGGGEGGVKSSFRRAEGGKGGRELPWGGGGKKGRSARWRRLSIAPSMNGKRGEKKEGCFNLQR